MHISEGINRIRKEAGKGRKGVKVVGKKGVDVESKTGNEEGAYYDTLDKHANFHLLSAQRERDRFYQYVVTR